MMIYWFVFGLFGGPWLAIQVTQVLYETLHIDNPLNNILICIIGVVLAASTVAVTLTKRVSRSAKTAIQGLWLGSAIGFGILYLYVWFVIRSGGYR